MRRQCERNHNEEPGLDMLRLKVVYAINVGRNERSTGSDEAPMKMLKLIDKENIDLFGEAVHRFL